MTLFHSRRFLTTLAMLVCLTATGLVGAQPGVAATKSCKDPAKKSGLNGGYFSKLRVTGKTCASGKKLVYAYYKCRMDKGGRKASCNNKTINGLKCTEYRNPDLDIPTEFNARVTCKKGSKKVVHVYQQNLT